MKHCSRSSIRSHSPAQRNCLKTIIQEKNRRALAHLDLADVSYVYFAFFASLAAFLVRIVLNLVILEDKIPIIKHLNR